MTRLRAAAHEETELLTVLKFPFRVRTPIRREHFKPGARKSRGVVHRIGWPVMEHDSQLAASCVHVRIRRIPPVLCRRFLGPSAAPPPDPRPLFHAHLHPPP